MDAGWKMTSEFQGKAWCNGSNKHTNTHAQAPYGISALGTNNTKHTVGQASKEDNVLVLGPSPSIAWLGKIHRFLCVC